MVWDEDIGENMPLPSPSPQQDVPDVPGDEPLDIGAQEVGDEFVQGLHHTTRSANQSSHRSL